jgi:predicted metal-binding protein
MYNTSLCCPPNSPTYLETRELLNCYEKALLIHYHKGFGGRTHPTKIAATLERDLFLSGYYRAFAFGEGPCMLCRECTFDRCVHPTEARPSMESCGIDVYSTARNNGFAIEVLKDRSSIPNRYGMVLIE